MPIARRSQLLQGVVLDLRHVLRRLRDSPGFTTVAVLSLAIGIGANTAIAGIARAAFFQPLSVDRPDQLALIAWDRGGMKVSNINGNGFTDPATGEQFSYTFSYRLYRQIANAPPTGAEVSALTFLRQVNVAVNGQPAAAAAALLTDDAYFTVVKPPFVLERGFNSEDARPNAEPTAVISYAFWRRAYAGSPSVLSMPVTVGGLSVRVVGVTGQGFRGVSQTSPTDLTLPLARQSQLAPQWAPASTSLFTSDGVHWLRLIARVRDDDARAVLLPFLETTMRGYAMGTGLTTGRDAVAKIRARLQPGVRGTDVTSASTRQSVTVLAAVVGIVLVIACVNLASLMLARGVARQHELAVRRALGASRWRLIRLTLLESFVIASLGAVAGMALTVWCHTAIASMVTAGIGRINVDWSIDLRLLGTTMAIACAASLLFGLLPALRLSTAGPAASTGRPGGNTAPRLLAGRVLMALQIAISMPLVAGAGLLLRTLHNLNSVDLGFQPAPLVLFTADATSGRADAIQTAEDYDRILERIRGVPGVASAALVENALLSGWESDTNVVIDGKKVHMFTNAVGPRFFETIGVPLLAGRFLDDGDREHTAPVVVINETAARNLFNNAAIGRRFEVEFFEANNWPAIGHREVEVVGVVSDTKYDNLRRAVPPTYYEPFRQRPRGMLGGAHFVVRTSSPAAALERLIRQAVTAASPLVAVTGYKTQLEQMDETIVREHVFGLLLTTFAGFALLLACIGLHGVTSYSVARRTGEIGVRIALGAQRRQVVWLILQNVLVLAVIGLAIGLPAALASGRVLKTMLFGLAASDPWTFVGAAIAMLTATAVAGWLPARRAASIDPMKAVRAE
jgi:predicted permease